MASIELIETAQPPHVVDRRMLGSVAEAWFGADEVSREKYLRLAENAGVDSRRLVRPYERTLALGGLAERAALFEECGSELLRTTLNGALDRFDGAPGDFGHSLFASCSVPLIPSIDGPVIERSRLDPTLSRLAIFQGGCAGGVIGLALGAKLAALGRPVLFSSVELCSLVFHPENRDGEQLVGAAIFGDGAATVVVSPGDGPLTVVDSMSYFVPESRHIMGYDLRDDGFHLRLDRALPQTILENLPAVVDRFLERRGLARSDISYWLVHPGGRKILDCLASAFALRDEQFHFARDVLRDCGNMSSATILFVLKRFMDSTSLAAGERALVFGIGPGLTFELLLLEGRGA